MTWYIFIYIIGLMYIMYIGIDIYTWQYMYTLACGVTKHFEGTRIQVSYPSLWFSPSISKASMHTLFLAITGGIDARPAKKPPVFFVFFGGEERGLARGKGWKPKVGGVPSLLSQVGMPIHLGFLENFWKFWKHLLHSQEEFPIVHSGDLSFLPNRLSG